MKKKLFKIVVILGSTSSGKTDLSLKLAKKFNGEIISADSRQIYRGMDIATGKIKADKDPPQPSFAKGGELPSSPFEKKVFFFDGILHYMIDIIDPDEDFSVAEYKKATVEIAEDIIKRGKVPFLVGGTGLYIKAVVDNLEIPRVLPNKKLRDEFECELAEASPPSQSYGVVIEKFYKRLLELDTGAKDLVDKNNPRRIIRALEICLATGKPFSEIRGKGERIFDTLQIGLEVSREVLYERIDKRVDKMMDEGLLEETKKLIKKGYSAKLPSMSGIGYKEMGEYLESEKLKMKNEKFKKDILKEKIQEMKWRTHAYARRQMTWFKKDGRIKWVKDYRETERLLKKWLT
ncbi:MAG TPA: tRNA (adenosine(37)-N6)-dimethylallyltransferase MiaA [Patescibacteria group bacterium]|nr:tRNA (adenosine(37)-N6)-dimethylallyltransferase MiaA [Patescibacteria group bacterium]